MSLDFKLPTPVSTGNLPVAAKGAARAPFADPAPFGVILAGSIHEAEARPAADPDAARPDMDWKTRKNIWAARELKGDPQHDEPGQVIDERNEVERDTGVVLPASAAVVAIARTAAADAASEAGAGQRQSNVAAGDQPRGRRTAEAGGKDDPKAASRYSAATADAAPGGRPSPAEAQFAKTASAGQAAASTSEAVGETGQEPPRGIAERPAEAGLTVREPGSRDRAEVKVMVVSSQVSVAPAAPAPAVSLSSTGSTFVTSLTSDGALPQYVTETSGITGTQDARPVTTLKIQLHPAELGTVTVKLSGAGEQLAVEVQVETNEARHRLATDSDAIVKALRGMGYDIDRITVQQAPSTAASNGGGTNRENPFTQDGRSGERRDQPARQGADQGHEQNARDGAASSGDRRRPSGSGVYI